MLLTLFGYLFAVAYARDGLEKLRRLDPDEYSELEQNCGLEMKSRAKRFVLNGKPVTDFKTPAVAISVPADGGSHYRPHCSGTLISKRHVLTAAHCIFDAKYNCTSGDVHSKLSNYRVVIRTTCSDFEDKNDYCIRHPKGPIIREVSNIMTPLNPTSIACRVNDKDIAIFELSEDVEADDDIFTACVRSQPSEIGDVVSISGYGKDNNHTAEQPKQGLLKTYDATIKKCDPYEAKDVFCLQDKLAELSCAGDSGAGAVISLGNRFSIAGVLVAGVTCEQVMSTPRVSLIRSEQVTSVHHYLKLICFVTGVCPVKEHADMYEQFDKGAGDDHPEFAIIIDHH